MNARIKYLVYATLLLISTFFFAARHLVSSSRNSEEVRLKQQVATDASLLALASVHGQKLHSNSHLKNLVRVCMRDKPYRHVVIKDPAQYKLAESGTSEDQEGLRMHREKIFAADGKPLGSVIVYYDQSKIDISMASVKHQLLLLFLLILNGIALPWIWFSNALERTYQEVISTLKHVDEGNLKARIDPKSGGGLNEVTLYFNQMLDSIERSNTQLQVYVSKLAEKNMEMTREVVVRKNAERIARQNEKKFHAIFDQSVQLICMMKPSGHIINTNAALGALLTNPKDKRPECKFTELSIWHDRKDQTDWLKEAIYQAQRGEVPQKELRLTDSNGHESFYDFSLKPVLDDSGTAAMIIAEGHDISARVSAEKALEDTEAQVRQSQKMEAIGQLAGGIAHDFNNLLTSILGFSNMVMDELDPDVHEDSRGDLQEVIFAAEKARGLTQKLLMLARKKLYHIEPIHLNEMLNQMVKIIQISLHDDIELITSFNRDIKYIEADSVSLEQIIINLAVNAKDAMPKSGRLYLSTETATLDQEFCDKHGGAAAGNFVRLSVRDTGTGIPPEVVEHIFEPFYTTKEPGKGTGLGLATVYGLVKQFKGLITVDSEPGAGTSFNIYLPEIDKIPEQLLSDQQDQDVPRGTETILMVEDEAAVRKLGVRMIESLGYKTLVAHDGEHALEVYETHGEEIDLVVTDVVMPRMTGPELIKELRVIRPDIKALYLSGFTKDKLLTHGADEDDAPLLQKPYNHHQLATMIRQVLDKANVQKHQIAS